MRRPQYRINYKNEKHPNPKRKRTERGDGRRDVPRRGKEPSSSVADFAKALLLSDKVLFNRVTGGGTARGNLNLPVDRGQMCADRARTDHQVHGDLRIRPALSD